MHRYELRPLPLVLCLTLFSSCSKASIRTPAGSASLPSASSAVGSDATPVVQSDRESPLDRFARGDREAQVMAQQMLWQSQVRKAAKVLALSNPDQLPTPEDIQSSGLLFFVPQSGAVVNATRTSTADSPLVSGQAEGTVLSFHLPEWPTHAKVDVKEIVEEFHASGVPGNYQPGVDLRLRLQEEFRTGKISEASAARGLMWESDQLEELSTDAFLTAIRFPLALYGATEGRLPVTLEEALAPLDAVLVHPPGVHPGLPCRLTVDSSRRFALWEVETTIGATYTELLALSENNKSVGTASHEEQADIDQLEFPHVLFDSRGITSSTPP